MDQVLFDPLSVAGGLAIALGALVSTAIAMWLLRHRRARGRHYRGRVALAAMAGAIVASVIVTTVEDAALELNPLLTEQQIAGTWQHRGATLTLSPAGAYTCIGGDACAPFEDRGQWRREGDFEVAFVPAHGVEQVHRVVNYRGAFRLTHMPDHDLWSRTLTFKRVAPAG